MANLIALTDFTAEYRIANISDPNKASQLQEYIDLHEADFIKSVLGIEIPSDDDDLKALLKKACVIYIYFLYVGKAIVNLSDSGYSIAKLENAEIINPVFQTNKVWNELNKAVYYVWDYCNTKNINIKPTFKIVYASWL